jgi:2-dehydro-3-deoxyphosphooctonate aldolase (KDO 8-P synthase)
MTKHISLTPSVTFGNNLPFVLLAGPCVMESREHALFMSRELVALTQALGIPFVYKTSFDKANRTSLTGARGTGVEKAKDIFKEIKETYGCPIVTDVHSESQCEAIADYVDILQIPAFLCRQTDLLKAAAATGKVINIKKGQFLAPWDMKNIVDKMEGFECETFLLCERGASFGYNTLVSDMRSLDIMKQTHYPVVFDATHSVQQPGGQGASSGGQREFVPVLARAAAAVGVASIFIETHDRPDEALSDGPNMVPLHELRALLETLVKFDQLAKNI